MIEKPIENIVKKSLDCVRKARQCHSDEMYDVALNRSYYGMFHSIQALLTAIDASPNKSHTGTHNAFHKNFIVTGIFSRERGIALKRIFEKRQFGDYSYEEVRKEDSEEGLVDAEKFISDVIDYLKENNHLK